jgi:hypothetical protein
LGTAPASLGVPAAFLDLVVQVAEHGAPLPALQSLFERGDLFRCYDPAQAYGTSMQQKRFRERWNVFHCRELRAEALIEEGNHVAGP